MTLTKTSGVSVPTNELSKVKEVVSGYDTEPAKGIVHGLQKDAIQNSWGQRRSAKKGTGWGTKFELLHNDKGTFLVIEDRGTHGMTGPNLSSEEIKQALELPPEHRLARFSSMHFSGGNVGAGLFGRGKTLFLATSNQRQYYFDTLTSEDGYRASSKWFEGVDLKIELPAFEGESAKRYIHNGTGLEPLSMIGSRIIIVDPISEVVESIKDGSFVSYIEETWWRIILKYNASITVKYAGHSYTAEVPFEFQNGIDEKNEYKRWNKKLIQAQNYHTIRNIELFYAGEDVPEDNRGVYFYRKDMKIGEIPLDIPSKIKKRYFGYVEVDLEWEEALATVETLEHYGVQNRRKKPFSALKDMVVQEHEQFMEDLGLKKRSSNFNQLLKNELQELSLGLDNFLETLNIEDLSEVNNNLKNKSTPIEVKWKGIEFSNQGNRQVTGDMITNINFCIKNNSGSTKNVHYKLKLVNKDVDLMTITGDNINIKGSSEETIGPFELTIDEPMVKYEKNILKLEVHFTGAKENIVKQIPIYYDITPVKQQGQNFMLNNVSMEFPREDSHRIDSDESITNVKYSIENKSADIAYVAFHLSTHNGEDKSKHMIDSVFINRDIILNPYEKMEIGCPDIIFEQQKYESHIKKGVIEVRARLSASQEFGDYDIAEELSKGSKITIFFNRDEESSRKTFEDIRSLDGVGELNERSKLEGRIFIIYLGHPAYQRVMDDDDARREYFIEEMLKQTILIHLKEGAQSILNVYEEEESSRENVEDLSSVDIVRKLYVALDNLQFRRISELDGV